MTVSTQWSLNNSYTKYILKAFNVVMFCITVIVMKTKNKTTNKHKSSPGVGNIQPVGQIRPSKQIFSFLN